MGPTSRSTLANRSWTAASWRASTLKACTRAAVGRDLVDQRLGLGGVAPRHADLQSAGGEASGDGGADGIARAHEQGDGPAGCHVRFLLILSLSV